jgi:hypothetical protein
MIFMAAAPVQARLHPLNRLSHAAMLAPGRPGITLKAPGAC